MPTNFFGSKMAEINVHSPRFAAVALAALLIGSLDAQDVFAQEQDPTSAQANVVANPGAAAAGAEMSPHSGRRREHSCGRRPARLLD